MDTGRLFGTNPAFAIQSIGQLAIAGWAVIRPGTTDHTDLSLIARIEILRSSTCGLG